MKFISTILLLLVVVFTGLAQTPQAINYQGVARDLSGNPIVNQNISLQISIIPLSPNGTAFYIERHSTTTNNLGLFNIQIGNGNPINQVFSNINWGIGDHYLQVGLDENGGNNYQIIGTSQLLSVPYALYALQSKSSHDKLWSQGNGEIFYDDENVRIGSPTVGASDGFLSVVGYDGDELLSDGKRMNSLAKIIDVSTDGGGLRVAVSNESDKSLFLKSAKNNSNLSFVTRTNQVNHERMTILNNGNIGIGSKNPLSRLHVINDIGIQYADGDAIIELFKIYDLFGERRMDIRHTYTNDVHLTDFNLFPVSNTVTSRFRFHRRTNSTDIVAVDFMRGNNSSNVSARVASNGADSFFQNHGGNLGIGVQEPKAKLHVNDGDVYIEDVNNGVIMKSSNGQCWRYRPNNNGQLVGSLVTCPN